LLQSVLEVLCFKKYSLLLLKLYFGIKIVGNSLILLKAFSIIRDSFDNSKTYTILKEYAKESFDSNYGEEMHIRRDYLDYEFEKIN
jgi:hypothetical protein